MNGDTVHVSVENGYASVRREWKPDDRIALRFQMPVRRIHGNPKLMGNSGQVAIQRGPFVYCIEDADFSNSVLGVSLPGKGVLSPTFEPSLLGGLVTVNGEAECVEGTATGLYHSGEAPARKVVPFRAIPYFAWDNRTPGAMRVWIPVS